MPSDKKYLYYQPYTGEFLSSSFVGLLEGVKSYNELADIFGLKHYGISGDSKVQWSWDWQFVLDFKPPNAITWVHANIYNWKDGPAYEHSLVETDYDRNFKRPWHIGGMTQEATDLVNYVVRHGDHPRHFINPYEADKDGQLILFK